MPPKPKPKSESKSGSKPKSKSGSKSKPKSGSKSKSKSKPKTKTKTGKETVATRNGPLKLSKHCKRTQPCKGEGRYLSRATCRCRTRTKAAAARLGDCGAGHYRSRLTGRCRKYRGHAVRFAFAFGAAEDARVVDAARAGDLSAVRGLLDSGLDVSWHAHGDAIIAAAQGEHLGVLRELLRHPHDKSAVWGHKQDALNWALNNRRVGVVRVLIDNNVWPSFLIPGGESRLKSLPGVYEYMN